MKCLRRLEEGFARLWPLPETAFKKESLTYKLLNKLAAFVDSISNKMNTGNYLLFCTSENVGDLGQTMKIDLNDLNRQQRARLFYAVKNWAPHVAVDDRAEEQLLGSTVPKDNRYTRLWFDLLTSKATTRREHALIVGERLKDEYTIEARLSSGGQATTYLATKTTGHKCVLKEFILASTSSGMLLESARQFEVEVGLLSQLEHPGIVRLEDFFSADGRVYVVLEYIEGQSLAQLVQQSGRLTQAQAVDISECVCEVLEYIHACNPPIVHRDIAPANILVQPDGKVKVIDFSLALKQDGQPTANGCAKQCFTPPEQFQDNPCPQSDIYAFGATMFYALTGATPKPISCSSPQLKCPEIPDEFNSIVERATKLNVSERYESVRWLKLDLLKFKRELDGTSQVIQVPADKVKVT